jgi:hypothetical protein
VPTPLLNLSKPTTPAYDPSPLFDDLSKVTSLLPEDQREAAESYLTSVPDESKDIERAAFADTHFIVKTLTDAGMETDFATVTENLDQARLQVSGWLGWVKEGDAPLTGVMFYRRVQKHIQKQKELKDGIVQMAQNLMADITSGESETTAYANFIGEWKTRPDYTPDDLKVLNDAREKLRVASGPAIQRLSPATKAVADFYKHIATSDAPSDELLANAQAELRKLNETERRRAIAFAAQNVGGILKPAEGDAKDQPGIVSRTGRALTSGLAQLADATAAWVNRVSDTGRKNLPKATQDEMDRQHADWSSLLQLRQAYDHIVDPVSRGGVPVFGDKYGVAEAYFGIIESAPDLAMVGANAPMAIPMMLGTHHEKRVVSGEGPTQAAVGALTDTLAMFVGGHSIFKGTMSSVEKAAVRSLSQIAANAGKRLAAETVANTAADALNIVLPEFAANLDAADPDRKPYGFTQAWEQLKEAGPVVAVGGVMMGLIATGSGAVRDTARFKEYASNADRWLATGFFTPEQAGEIASLAESGDWRAKAQEFYDLNLREHKEWLASEGRIAQSEAIGRLSAEQPAATAKTAVVVPQGDGTFAVRSTETGEVVGLASTALDAADLVARHDDAHRTSFAFTTSTDAIEHVKAMKDDPARADELNAYNENAVRHALSTVPGVTVNMTQVAGVFDGGHEISTRVDITAKTPEDLQAARQRMVDVARIHEQFELHEIGPDGDASRIGQVDADGSQNQPVVTMEAGDATPEQIEAARKEAGLDGLSVAEDGTIIAYNIYDHTQPEKSSPAAFSARVGKFRDILAATLGHDIPSRTEVRRIRRYANGKGATTEGRIAYDDVSPEQGAGRLVNQLIVRIPEMVKRIFDAPKGKRSFFTLKDYAESFQEWKQEIADAYEAMPVNGLNDPNVVKAYQHLAVEVLKQFKILTRGKNGMRFTFENYVRKDAAGNEIQGDLYASSKDAVQDARENNHLRVLKTDPTAFGPDGSDFADHPLLKETGLTYADANGKTQPLLYNDIFRAVHDAIAHTMFGDTFGPVGEEGAWNVHLRTLDDPWARWALTTETRGQNSWVNEGPQMRGPDGKLLKEGDEGFLPQKMRSFAVQKANLLPIEMAMTGDPKVDAPMRALQRELDGQTEGPAPYSKEALAKAYNLTPEQAEDSHTTVVAMGLDTSKMSVAQVGEVLGLTQRARKPLEGSLGEGVLEFTHYSGNAGIVKLDPAKHGKSGVTPRSEMSGLARSYGYANVRGSVEEGDIAARPNKYTGTVSKGLIYDGYKDIYGYNQMINRWKADQMLVDKGFIGIYREGFDRTRKQVEFFKPVEVRASDKGASVEKAETYSIAKNRKLGTYEVKDSNGDVVADGYAMREGAQAWIDENSKGDTLNQEADQTNTPEFKAWFGDSKVVDADGKPLVVYHGTNKSFTKISMKKGAQGVFWVTSDKSSIEKGESGAQGTSKIMELYAKIERPAGWEEYGKKSLGELIRDGYDGVILPNKDGSFNAIIFDPNQVKSATGNRGTFDPNDPNILHQLAAPTYYSRLIRTVEQSQQGKATGAQWKATIKNSKLGANADEFALVGVGDLEDGKTYTKQEVLDYLRANEVQVKDVTLGEPPDRKAVEIDGAWGIEDPDGMVRERGFANQRAAERAILADAGNQQGISAGDDLNYDTHFSQYQLPGAVEGSYREVLLTVPRASPASTPASLEWRRYIAELAEKYGEGFYARGEGTRSERAMLEALHERADHGSPPVAWRDGHSQYSEHANPIVRLRLNERVSNTYTPEQIADIGRRMVAAVGAKTEKSLGSGAPISAIQKGAITPLEGAQYSHAKGWTSGVDQTGAVKRMLFLEEVQAPQKGQFDKMPALFQKNWREIAFKWALRYAADNGFDVVGWTTGEMQAERYDLSKQVDEVRLEDDGTLYGYKDGTEVIQQDNVDDAKLADYIGKDAAQKLLAQERKEQGGGWVVRDKDGNSISISTKQTPGAVWEPRKFRTLQVEQLKVGGEGLRKLYDVDFRNVVNGLPAVKKAGQKVGTAEIEATDKGSGYELLKNGEPIATGGEDAARRWENTAGYPVVNRAWERPGLGGTTDRMEIRKTPDRTESHVVHSLDLTPAIKDAVMQGQPLAQHGQEGKQGNIKGSVSFSADGHALLRGFAAADVSTGLHEISHVARHQLFDRSKPESERMSDADIAIAEEACGVVDGKWTVAAEEKFARMFEQYMAEGKAPTPELAGLFQRMSEWLLKIYRGIKGTDIDAGLSDPMRRVFDRLMQRNKEAAIEGPQNATGIKNSAIDAQLEEMGLPPATHGEKTTFKAATERAAATMQADPTAGQRLVAELTAKPRPVTGDEDALLLMEQTRLGNERAAAERAVIDAAAAGNAAALADAQARVAKATADYAAAAEASTKAGTANAQGLALRRMMMKEDYSLASIERRMIAANEGKPLNEQQAQEIRDLQAKLAEAERAFDDYRAQQAAEPSAPKAKRVNRVQKMLEERATAARDRINRRLLGEMTELENVTLNQEGVPKLTSYDQQDTPPEQRIYYHGISGRRLVEYRATQDIPTARQAFGGDYSITDDYAFAKMHSGDGVVLAIKVDERTSFAHRNPHEDGPTDADIEDVGEGEYLVNRATGIRVVGEFSDTLAQLAPEYADHAIVGALHIAEGKTAFADWSKVMLAEFPELPGSSLRDIYEASQGQRSQASRLAAVKTRTANRAEELKGRLAGQPPKEPRRPLELDDEALRLKSEVEWLKKEVAKMEDRLAYEHASTAKKVAIGTLAAYDVSRTLMSTGEASFVLRQALPLVTNPQNVGSVMRAAKAALEAFVANPTEAHAINLRVLEHPETARMVQDGLYFSDDTVQSLSQQEEFAMGKWVGKVPLVGRFTRAGVIFLNRMRFDVMHRLTKDFLKPEDAAVRKQAAIFVNEATGRGSLGPLNRHAVLLNRLMFSARFRASRIQLLLGHAMWGGTMQSRRIIAAEYAKAALGIAAMHSVLMAVLGDEDENKPTVDTIPTESDFLKIKLGRQRLDLLGGIGQQMVMAARTLNAVRAAAKREAGMEANTTDNEAAREWGLAAGRYVKNSLHPTLGSAYAILSGKGGDYQPTTAMKELWGTVHPMTYDDIAYALHEQQVDDATILTIMALLGAGLQTHTSEQPHATEDEAK